MWTQLAEWEVAAEDGQARFTEGSGEFREEWRLAVCSCPVGEDEAIAGGACWNVEEAANERFSGVVTERRCDRLAHWN